MKTLFKLFTRGWFLGLLALTLLALVIWYGGPYLAFGTVRPFDGVVARLVTILVVVVLWTVWVQIRQLRAQRAGVQLVREVAQAPAAKAAGPGAAEAQKLRARFDEAVAELRSTKGKAVNLYELPWYIIIGPPGAGKTTVIANSGLNFPLAKKLGKEALKGVGGTRNCDWWFTSEAILLDTAGRYTTQDSDAESDHAGWMEFLSLLRRHRGRRPINGIILAMSASDLIAQSESDRRRHVEAIRLRLDELSRELKVTLPVYLLVTKLDLVAGFTEFFDDLNAEGRSQVWGVTFPIELSRSGEAAGTLAGELDQLIERLSSRLMLRLGSERDVRRRTLVFTFPRQFAALKRPLTELVTEAFPAGESEGRMQLRGVYLTSGTQEGTPIDRMMGSLARSFGLSMQGAISQPAQGRAYFIQRLLKEILFRESGLAGVNRALEVRQALVQAAVYVGLAAVTVLAVILFSVSYARNRAYLADVSVMAEPLRSVPATLDDRPLVADLPRLDALENVLKKAREYEHSVPITMRWGLYQGRSLTNAADDAYVRELNARLLPAVAEHFHSRLVGFADEPQKLYEYLKAYLMLGQPEHLDVTELGFLSKLEWQRVFADDPGLGERLQRHFSALIADADRVQAVTPDATTLEQARTSLRQVSLPVLMYSRLKLKYSGDTEHALDLGREIGLGGDSVFVRRSGEPLGQAVPALYTRRTFDEISTTGKLELIQQFVSENWVLGGDLADATKSPRLASDVIQLYEDDYIRAWDGLLGDITLRKASGTQQAAELWGVLAAPSSPLKRLLVVVEAQTNLLKPDAKSDLASQAQKAVASKLDALGKMFGGDKSQQPAAPPGTRVTQHFAAVHKLVQGSPPPIDLTLEKFANIQRTLAEVNALGGPPPLELATRLSLALKDLDTHAKTLPGPFDSVVTRATGQGAAVVSSSIGNDFSSRYTQQVVSECRSLAAGRYPLARGGADLPLADFGRLFAANGVFETFFRTTMANFVETNRPTWQWKVEAASIGGARGTPAQFQRAERVRQVYFPAGAAQPEVRFSLAPSYLDANVSRMTVEIDGQSLEYRHGPVRAVAMTWPGPSPGQATITFEDRNGTRPNAVEQGPWAVFRLLDKATVEAQSDTTYLVTFNLGGRQAKLLLQAASSRNPFGSNNVLQGFGCAN
jgi:type VI secretion system protein ImpL